MKTPWSTLLAAASFSLLFPSLALAQQAEAIHESEVHEAVKDAPTRMIPKGASDPKLTKSADPETKRVYTKDAVVVTHASGIVDRQPYAAIPILFRVNSDELLDRVSQQNVRETAAALRPLLADGARFTVEGHASAEGSEQRNLELSKLRAAKIRALLTEGERLDGGKLNDRGFGATHAQATTALESERQKDRRVLVVRVQ